MIDRSIVVLQELNVLTLPTVCRKAKNNTQFNRKCFS